MIIINPLKPFYIDKKNKIIRMGNFKDFGKEIEFEDDSLVKLFRLISKPILKDNLINKMEKETGLSESDIVEAIEYLMEEKFIINYDDYDELLKNNKLNRQYLFFSMCRDELKDWNLIVQPNILILGLGGVGSNVSLVLSRSGFNNFTLVDCDKVEGSNLIRQLPYTENDIGKYKTSVIAEKIKSNDNIINIYNKKIVKDEDIEQEIINSDFVICTLDKPSRIIRRVINNLCVKYNKPVIFSGFAEHVAMIGPFIEPRKSACLKCIEKNMLEEPMNNVKITPSYGPLCLLISSLVSSEVINYFYKYNKNNLIGKTLMFNMLTYEQEIIKWNIKEDCEVCGNDCK